MRALVDFIEPHGLIWLALAWMTFSPLNRMKWRAAVFPGLAWLLATLMLCTPIPSWFVSRLEQPWSAVNVDEMTACDAVVSLGGGFEPSRMEPHALRLKGGADRLLAAIEVTRRGKAGALVVGGGGFRFEDDTKSEADAVKSWVENWKLSGVPVYSLGICSDTHDEAVKTASLAKERGWKQIALVTSATHMTRAKATFDKAGVTVVPVPCNFLSEQLRQGKSYWLKTPDLTGFLYFEGWMHEVIGTWVYQWNGWM